MRNISFCLCDLKLAIIIIHMHAETFSFNSQCSYIGQKNQHKKHAANSTDVVIGIDHS